MLLLLGKLFVCGLVTIDLTICQMFGMCRTPSLSTGQIHGAKTSLGGMLPSCHFARAIYQFVNWCWVPCTVFPWIQRNQHGMFHEATSNALLAATISLLLVLFVTLSCIDDKQVAPSNDMSLDRSPMHLGERRMGVQVENWCSECDAVREMLSSRAGHITVTTVYLYIYILIYCNVAIHYACACYSLLLKHLLQLPIIPVVPHKAVAEVSRIGNV